MQPRVLQIGGDEMLLQTRGAILRHAGFTVESCFVTNRPDSAHICLERYFEHLETEAPENGSHFQAVILCHTLDKERATTIATEARREEPGIKIVILEAMDGPRLPANLYDVSVSCKYGPATMVRVVKALFPEGQQPDGQQPATEPPRTSPSPTGHAGARRPPPAPARPSPPGK